MENFKDLEEVRIKALTEIQIKDRVIEPGEVIAQFDNIQIAGLQGVEQSVTAHGGYNDVAHVEWKALNNLSLQFTQGVFSKTQFALMNNSKLLTSNGIEALELSQREIKESDASGIITLKRNPIYTPFLYYSSTGERIMYFTCEDNILSGLIPFTEVIIDYQFLYQNNVTIFALGNILTNSYVALEGRTRIKDDLTGAVVTGIIKIPKLRIDSSIHMTLGENAIPLVQTFNATAYPIGPRGNQTIAYIYELSDDITSDL